MIQNRARKQKSDCVLISTGLSPGTISVRHATIDLYHKKLFESVAILMRMIDAKDFSHIGSVLAFLTKYVDVHFRSEDDLMKSCAYTFYDDNKAQHDRFAHTITDAFTF